MTSRQIFFEKIRYPGSGGLFQKRNLMLMPGCSEKAITEEKRTVSALASREGSSRKALSHIQALLSQNSPGCMESHQEKQKTYRQKTRCASSLLLYCRCKTEPGLSRISQSRPVTNDGILCSSPSASGKPSNKSLP